MLRQIPDTAQRPSVAFPYVDGHAAADLRRGIEQGELLLHFQPQVDLATGGVIAVEALVRWDHPSRGLLPPGAFVPLAESTDLIHPLTEWVLDDAMRACRTWLDGGRSVRVAVNLAACSLLDARLPASIGWMLTRHGLSPSHLGLEITESVVMENPAVAGGVMRRLRDMGIRLAIDDFGTGHSSLGYLRRLDVHEIKIDRSFLGGFLVHDRDRRLMQAIVDLGHCLDLDVVAEGVEDAFSLQALARMGCDAAQGFHIARPMPASEVTGHLSRVTAVAPGDLKLLAAR